MSHKYTKEEDQFLANNVKGITLKELTNKFNNQFNLNQSENAIGCRKNTLSLTSGIVGGQFKKGHITWNKGTKGLTKANKTSFKKGDVPQNYRPVGSERITKDGYIEIKIADPNKWETKNRIVYREHYGEIPPGHKVIYADGNKLNNDPSNLILVSDSEELIMNRHNLRFDKKELTTTGHLIAKVIDKSNKVNNERL